MSNSWIRKDFYLPAPEKGSTVEQWKDWLNKDRKAAISDKRAFTKSQKAENLPDSFQPTETRKVNGVWRSVTAIGFAGDMENGGQLEPVVQPSQERDLARNNIIPTPRGVSHKHSGNHNRKVHRDALKAANSHFAQLRRKGKLS